MIIMNNSCFLNMNNPCIIIHVPMFWPKCRSSSGDDYKHWSESNLCFNSMSGNDFYLRENFEHFDTARSPGSSKSGSKSAMASTSG